MAKSIEILCILDRSGSMASIINEAIAAFNAFVEQQQQLAGKAKLTLALFDDQYELLYERIKLAKVPALTLDAATPRGMTALYDAVGRTLTHAKQDRKTICLIQTDGFENASQEYSAKQLKKLITEKQKSGWAFVFIGAGIDAFDAGSSLGLSIEQCVSVTATAAGMEDFSEVLSERASNYRTRH